MKRDLTLGGGDKIADWGGGAGRGWGGDMSPPVYMLKEALS